MSEISEGDQCDPRNPEDSQCTSGTTCCPDLHDNGFNCQENPCEDCQKTDGFCSDLNGKCEIHGDCKRPFMCCGKHCSSGNNFEGSKICLKPEDCCCRSDADCSAPNEKEICCMDCTRKDKGFVCRKESYLTTEFCTVSIGGTATCPLQVVMGAKNSSEKI